MHIRLVACLGLSLAPGMVSQNPTGLVVPPAFASKMGTGSTNVPFGRSAPMRAQFVFAPSLIPVPTMVKGLGLRPDERFKGVAKRVTLHLHLSTLPTRVVGLRPEFARNRGANLTSVFGRSHLSLPGKATLSSGTPFPVRVPFARSFYYPRNGPLMLDFEVLEQSAGRYRIDSNGVCASPMRYYGPKGCGPAGGPVLRLESMTRHVVWGNSVVLRASGARPGALTHLFIGSQGSGTWNGINLPFHAQSIGAPGCYLSTSVLIAPRRFADRLGVADFAFSIPPWIGLQGGEVTIQAIAADKTANPLGIVSSQAARLRICGFEPVGRVFANGVKPTVGYREFGFAPIVRLETF